MPASALQQAALRLSARDRADLARALFESLDVRRELERPGPAHVAADAEWFVADLVVRITVGRQVVVHVNTVLVQAMSAANAYDRARELGRAYATSYVNTDGQRVVVRFVGLLGLNVVHDPLEHGAELLYDEHVGLSARKIRKLITPKRKLGVFRRRTMSRVNYASGSILAELVATALATPPRPTQRRPKHRRAARR